MPPLGGSGGMPPPEKYMILSILEVLYCTYTGVAIQ